MNCPVCNEANDKEFMYLVRGVWYVRCADCKSIYAKNEIVPETENDKPEERNVEETNLNRLQRLTNALGEEPKSVLDVGCGLGEFVKLLVSRDIAAIGIDKQHTLNMVSFEFKAITMIEVIEHLEFPGTVLTLLEAKLSSGGVMMIETTFAEDIQDLTNHSYVDPTIGHRCIISRKGLEMILPNNLKIDKYLNANVVILRKVTTLD